MDGEQGMASSETPQSSTKPCRACCYPMPAAANKCTKCSGVQNWQRFLGASGTILSLVVALVSILSFAIPIWVATFTPKIARPQAALVEVDGQGNATFAVSNNGTASAAIEDILVGRADAVAWFDFSGTEPGDRIVKPGEVRLYRLKLLVTNDEAGVGPLVTMFRAAGPCRADLGVVTPDGRRGRTQIDTSSAGVSEADARKPCPLKLDKLITMTLGRIGNDAAYVGTLCDYAAKHPRDPNHPVTGSACVGRPAPPAEAQP